MKKLMILAMIASITACSSGGNRYLDVTSELCPDGVDSYSVSDDNRTRLSCKSGEGFIIDSDDELDVMRDINSTFCKFSGLSRFHSSNDYYTFTCKSGERINLPVSEVR